MPSHQDRPGSAKLEGSSSIQPSAKIVVPFTGRIGVASGELVMGFADLFPSVAQPALGPKYVVTFFLAILSSPKPKYSERRAAVRNTWLKIPLQTIDGASYTVAYRFFVGQPTEESRSSTIRKEAGVYRDIVLLPLVDDYRNLTLKTLLVLRWAQQNVECKYLAKIDDDTFLRPDHLLRAMPSPPMKGVYWGHVHYQAVPFRDPSHPVYVSKEQWERDVYPPFVTGNIYVLSNDVVDYFVGQWRQAQLTGTGFIPLEDVQLGIWAEGVGFLPRNDPGLFLCCPWEGERQQCHEKAISEHYVEPNDMMSMHAALLRTGKMCQNLTASRKNLTSRLNLRGLND
eukprot:gnl/MRDRNA2_/MRDRNA2_152741_c0_seq1.p1 gnl/MRDRNA2_/MRDRNA2_152741_c0~~gnl/MRDRNA2_/MRDRNA2_152741_c0_seq1.p1  ORF type:complete len:349 (-),score=52.55 gnl/MRDRNA2_/MRDRNA2_152741_c0_seq1:240-1262(-)